MVPLLMSAALALVFGSLIPVFGASALFGALGLAAWAAWAPAGERAVARVLLGAHEPTMFQRYTLAPVAQLLLDYTGDPPERLQLRVIKNPEVAAYGCGRGTLLVCTGLIEALARNRLPATEAAAVITHELGVMRAGLTRSEPPLLVLLLPWRLWLTVMGAMWHVAKSLIPGPLFRIAPGLMFGAMLWLGYNRGDPAYFLAAALLAVAFGTYRAHLWWANERSRVGDRYVYQCGLGQPLANILMRSHDDRHTRDRVVRLRTGVFATHGTDTGWATPAPGDLPARP
ncbi:hypothetical protein [Ornithinimicrobium murale]|uniref:hypothetical protein n=1 Tax=Ornithinimicrobium murale TaxID=1050153 RepID=UPI000E0D29B9|nr:hypothetical protein [Ornithinimicrobium murale]